MNAAIAGEERAIHRLLDLVQPDIRRFANRQCRSPSFVDDAVQDVMWVLYRNIRALRTATALTAWLITAVRRACLRLARTLAFGADIFSDHADESRLAAMPVADLRLDLAAAINSLPLHYREIVILRDVEEMTVTEIGCALGLTREAVKGRLHRARSLLREYLS